MLSDFAEKVEQADRSQPFCVIEESCLGLTGSEIKQTLQLLFDAADIVLDLLIGKQLPFLTLAAWISNSSGCSPATAIG